MLAGLRASFVEEIPERRDMIENIIIRPERDFLSSCIVPYTA